MANEPGASPLTRAARAVFGPLPVGIAIATVAGAVFLSPLLLIPGVIAWAIAVAAMAAGRRTGQRARIDTTGLPPSIQADLAGVGRALDDMEAALAAVPADRRVLFASVEADAREVRDAVARMARSAGALHGYLARNRADEMQVQLEGLRRRLAAATDPAARSETEAAIAHSEARLARREQLMATLQRYRATIRGLQASAEELAGRAVNLTAGGELVAHAEFGEESSVRKIAELKAGVAALEEVMRSDIETV